MRISDWSSDVCSSDLIRPESEAEARAVFDKWDLDFAVIGEVTETGRIVLTKDGAVQADIPVGPLVTEAPEYDRSEEHTSELQSLMRISYAVFCLKNKNK